MLASRASAHQWTLTEAIADFKSDGTYRVDFLFDVDSLLAGFPPGHMTPDVYDWYIANTTLEERKQRIEEARDSFGRTIRIRFDGEIVRPLIQFPELGEGPDSNPEQTQWPGKTVRLSGKIPAGARQFTFWASRSYGPVVLRLRQGESKEETQQVLNVAQQSAPYPLTVHAPTQSRLTVALQYLRLGYTHILPDGWDHILFVLGLFLLGRRIKPLLFQVTAFTVAHSVTLGLAMYGILSLPSRVVEPMIALSIAYVAAENLFTGDLKPWRTAVVFCFGLLHGLGFAGALRELGLPRNQFAVALATFNVGVECGQLSVIALAFLVVGWFRNRTWYRKRVTIPVSCLIALTGLVAMIQRIFWVS